VPRRLDFQDDADGDSTATPDSAANTAQQRLSLAAAAQLPKTRLKLEEIDDHITDFKSAVGNVDAEAHALFQADDWAALVSSSSAATEANKRIAVAVMASLDANSKSVVLFRSALREADGTDRPGILSSGMDILQEMTALITDRSHGEIELNSEESEVIAFKPGAGIDDSRLVGETIKKRFVLKPAIQRAVPNAMLHEILSKYPESDSELKSQKKAYKSKLYKSDMAGEPPPWTVKKLIDDIAVDMACASPAAELSVTEELPIKSPSIKIQLTSTYKCSNCGAVGKHLNQDCPQKCSDCNFNFCPGARGELCAVLCDLPPSKRSLQNGIGKDLHPFLVGKLDTAWKAKHPGKEVSSLEIQNDSDSDSEVPAFGLVIPSA